MICNYKPGEQVVAPPPSIHKRAVGAVLSVLRNTLRMPGHPAAATLWIGAVATTMLAVLGLVTGKGEWWALAEISAILWANALLGRACEALCGRWSERWRIPESRPSEVEPLARPADRRDVELRVKESEVFLQRLILRR